MTRWMVWYDPRVREILEADSLTDCANLVRETREHREFTIAPFKGWRDYIRAVHRVSDDTKVDMRIADAPDKCPPSYASRVKKKVGASDYIPPKYGPGLNGLG